MFRTKAIKSVKNVLSFGRRTSCEEKQSLFSKSRESSLESEVNTMREDGDTDTEIFSAEDIGLDRLDRYIVLLLFLYLLVSGCYGCVRDICYLVP